MAVGIKILQLSKDEWRERFSALAHELVFGTAWFQDLDHKIDFAFLGVSAEDSPVVYATCREQGSGVYLQFGGVIPEYRGKGICGEFLDGVIEKTKSTYKRISFLVENTNAAMVRAAASKNFVITGLRNFENKVLLEHTLEWGS